MKITIAKSAGYCFGVRDAVKLAYDTAEKYGDVYMLGDIVHNEKVVQDLNNAGAKIVDHLDDIPDESPVLFRAHGTKPDVWKDAEKRNINIIDATCPLVHEIHREVKQLEEEGRRIIIIGDHGHDEVIAIAEQVRKPIIISSKSEAESIRRIKKAGIVSQSTQMIENVQEIINILIKKVFDLRFVNTICFPTKRNHEQIKEMAGENDIMIIIGSFTSANSKRLTELSKQRNDNSHQVTCADDLDINWFKNMDSVGISAGASTPDYLIEEVRHKIQNIDKDII